MCEPIRTLSSTVIVRKSWMFWNVRAIPLRTIREAGVRSRLEPANSSAPSSGR